MRVCSKCKETKNSDFFYSDVSKKDKLSSYCKACSSEKNQKRYLLQKDDIKEYKANYYLLNKKRIKLKNKEAHIKRRNKKGISPRTSSEQAEKNRKEYLKNYYLINKEKLKQRFKETYYKNRPSTVKTRFVGSAEEKIAYKKEKAKEFRQKNKNKLNAKNNKRRALKLKQTPKWADIKAIEEFYKNCPKGFHVDHIIPLKGKNVRGLHVLENLQYLPAIENMKKGNRI